MNRTVGTVVPTKITFLLQGKSSRKKSSDLKPRLQEITSAYQLLITLSFS